MNIVPAENAAAQDAIKPIKIGEVTIGVRNGLYCLNDAHRGCVGADGKPRQDKKPGQWLRRKSVKELISMLEAAKGCNSQVPKQGLGNPVIVSIQGGAHQGTYGNRTVLLSYAAWLDLRLFVQIMQSLSDPALVNLFDMLNNMDVVDLPPDRFVFVAQEPETGFYRVGISKDPVARIDKLSEGRSNPLVLLFVYRAAPSGYLSKWEAHRALEHHMLGGDWFDTSADLTALPPYPC